MQRPSSTRCSEPAEPVDESLHGWTPGWVSRFLRCAACEGIELESDAEGVACRRCGARLRGQGPRVASALAALEPEAESGPAATVTERVRRFYEAHPFPNYDGFESVGDLLARAARSGYAAQLDRQIPAGASVLEVGCGTGQLSLFLSVGGRPTVGVDMSRASLALAGEFASRHRLDNCRFLQADLFDLPLRDAAFDLVMCRGALHHTHDARGGFEALCRLVRPGGYVIVGLYNRVARIPTTLRRLKMRLFGGDHRRGDVVLRDLARSDEKAQSWFLDQYAHPHETRHSVDEVLAWFRAAGIQYVGAAPPLRLGERFDPGAPLFQARDPGSRLEHWLVQLLWLTSISREGALFDVIGRRPPAAG